MSMPSNNSWDGRWSGEDRNYEVVCNIGKSKKATIRGIEILRQGSYYYDFGDGWGAEVAVSEIEGRAAPKIRRGSHGFCGYDWMVDSIMQDQTITPPSKR